MSESGNAELFHVWRFAGRHARDGVACRQRHRLRDFASTPFFGSKLDRPRGKLGFGAVEYRRAAHPADAFARAAGGIDSLHPAAHRVSLPAASAGYTNASEQSDFDRPRLGVDLFPDAA